MTRATRNSLPAPLRWLRQRALLRLNSASDGGFILLEAMIAITLITVIMGAVGAEFVNGLVNTDNQRSRTTAVQLADTSMESLRALHASDLLKGRDKVSVDAEQAALSAIPSVQPWVSAAANLRAYDLTAASGTGTTTRAVIRTTAATTVVGGLSYKTYRYLECAVPTSDNSCTAAKASVTGTPVSLRAVAAVTWPSKSCPARTCAYVTSTVINNSADPVFQLNQTLPPAPVVTNPGDQTVAVGDTVSLQLLVQNGKGVAPFTWTLTSGSLPTGLTMNTAGLITGPVGGVATAKQNVTVTVTDGFLRTATVTFGWTVLARLAFNPVTDQSSTTVTTVALTVSATGGSGTGYVFTDPTSSLPPGLTLTAGGTITGNPRAPVPHNYRVSLVVTDSTGTRSASTTFNWMINYPPLGVSNPGALTSTVSTALVSPVLQMTASGGDGAYVWTAAGLPSGLSIDSSSGLVTGVPTTQSSKSVTVTVSDPSATVAPKSTTFTWVIVAKPTVTTPPTQKDTKGGTVSYQASATCPNSPCSYALTGQPNGLTINAGTGLVSGTVAGNATTSTTVTITVTDAAGASVPSTPFTWTITAQPTLIGLTTHGVTEGMNDSVPITYTCPYISCRIALANSVPGLGLTTDGRSGNNSATSLAVVGTSGTVYVSGTVQGSAVTTGSSKTYPVGLAITDGDNVTPSGVAATWTAYVAPTITGLADTSVARRSSRSQSPSYNCPTGSCSIQVGTGSPAWFTVGKNTGTADNPGTFTVAPTSGTFKAIGNPAATDSTGAKTVRIAITDANGYGVTFSATWTVTT